MNTTQNVIDRALLVIGAQYLSSRARRRLALLLIDAQYLACRARRARLAGALAEIRQVGKQLDALDPESPAARDVMDAAAAILDRNADTLELMGA